MGERFDRSIAELRDADDGERREPATGLSFTERMTGYLRLGASESPLGPPRARGLDASDVSFVCTLLWDDLDALLEDPSVLARSLGTVDAPALSPHALRVLDGRFRLLVPQEDGSLRMVHQLVVEPHDGAKRFFIDGYQTVDAEKGGGVWPDTTILFFSLHEGGDPRGRPIGHGAVEMQLGGLMRQISTMRGSPVPFIASFAARMRDVYGAFLGRAGG